MSSGKVFSKVNSRRLLGFLVNRQVAGPIRYSAYVNNPNS